MNFHVKSLNVENSATLVFFKLKGVFVNNIEIAFFCRNLALFAFSIFILWCSQFVIFSSPKKYDLISEYGFAKKIKPIYKAGNIDGYEIYINENVYVLGWLGFKLSENDFEEITFNKGLHILFYSDCYFFCDKKIYEISSNEKVVLSFERLKKGYENDRERKIYLIPYIFIAMVAGIFFLHFYAARLGEVGRKDGVMR